MAYQDVGAVLLDLKNKTTASDFHISDVQSHVSQQDRALWNGWSTIIRPVFASAATVAVTSTQAVYYVALDSASTVTQNVAALSLNGTAEAAWKLLLDLTTTNALSSTIAGVTFDSQPEFTVTGRYEFAMTPLDGVRVQARQTWPECCGWQAMQMGGTFDGPWDLNYAIGTNALAFFRGHWKDDHIMVRVGVFSSAAVTLRGKSIFSTASDGVLNDDNFSSTNSAGGGHQAHSDGVRAAPGICRKPAAHHPFESRIFGRRHKGSACRISAPSTRWKKRPTPLAGGREGDEMMNGVKTDRGEMSAIGQRTGAPRGRRRNGLLGHTMRREVDMDGTEVTGSWIRGTPQGLDWDYVLTGDAELVLDGDWGCGEFRNRWLRIRVRDGGTRVTVFKGYAWDGPTAVPDFRGTVLASVFHDAVYQFSAELVRAWSWSLYRVLVFGDRVFKEAMAGTGTNAAVRHVYYAGVRVFGYPFRVVSSWFGKG